ncbi:FecR family protein [Thalassospira lucentensis]|uniref:FecR family protein n=1 Tax=Thalassospira lucentensis TaxID=168935 RepID=UPI003AA944FF
MLNAYDEDMIALSDQAIEWLVRLHSGDATAADYAAFDAWRGQSVNHQRAALDAETLMGAVDETSAAQNWAGAGTGTGTGAEFVSPNRSAMPLRRRRPAQSAPRALFGSRRAVIAMASLCAVLALMIVGGIQGIGILDRWNADYSTGIGQFETVTLPDGTVAHMNTASAFSVDYSGDVRRIDLTAGEVIFEVAKDAAHPFIVSVLGGEAMAVGTVYGVRIDGDHTRVTVQEGIVEVSNGAGKAVRLVAGEQASYQVGTPPVLGGDINLATYGSWQRGKLIFNRRSLGDVIDEVQRYQTGRIIIARDRLRDLKVTGVFDIAELDDLLASLTQTTSACILKLPLVTVIY